MAICVPAFLQTGHDLDALFAKTRTPAKLIVDLRGCRGGRVDSLHASLEHIFNHDVSLDVKSLEPVGVSPDQAFLPTPADLLAHRDHVLSFAASLLGVQITPDQAAKVFVPARP